MRILRIVGILRLIAVPVVILRNKVCTSDVAVSLIELVVDNVSNDLLVTVPDSIDFYPSTVFIIS